MTSKQIKAEIRETKREMKESGIKVCSCFNGGHSAESYRYNARLFQLKVWLDDAIKAEDKAAAGAGWLSLA